MHVPTSMLQMAVLRDDAKGYVNKRGYALSGVRGEPHIKTINHARAATMTAGGRSRGFALPVRPGELRNPEISTAILTMRTYRIANRSRSLLLQIIFVLSRRAFCRFVFA